jgi:membrane associated rhomboid family serine protease
MGVADRDFMREQPPRAGDGTRMGPVTLWLIILNVAVSFLDPLLFNLAGVYYILPRGPQALEPILPITGLGHFSVLLAIADLELWRLITFQFVHAGPVHLLFNMLGLYFFGPMIESYLGSRRYLAFYLLCGVGGPVAYMFLWKARILIADPATPLVGASAGIFGILIAAARLAPDSTVLIYGIVPMKLRTLAWALMAISVYTVLAYGASNKYNAGGEAAHLGGAIVGFLLIRNPDVLNVFNFDFLSRRRPPPF